MNNSYEKVYDVNEILNKISDINDSIKDDDKTDMTEIINYLIDIGGAFEEARLHNKSLDNMQLLVSNMRLLLDNKSKYINEFTTSFGIKKIWDDFVEKILSGNFNFHSLENVVKIKDNLVHEMEVLNYIYNKRQSEGKNVDIDTDDIKRTIDSIHNSDMTFLVIMNFIGRSFRKEYAERKIERKAYDLTTFSSLDEENKYIERSTKQFSLTDCFTKHRNSNALIILGNDCEYAIEPVNIHMRAAAKLYKTLGKSERSIAEELCANNRYGNITISILNRDGLKAIIPSFPQKINAAQLSKLESYLDELKVIAVTLTDCDMDIFYEGLSAIEDEINKYKRRDKEVKSSYVV